MHIVQLPPCTNKLRILYLSLSFLRKCIIYQISDSSPIFLLPFLLMTRGGLEGLGILSVHHNTLNGKIKLLGLHGLSTSSTFLFVSSCVSPSWIIFENDVVITVELSAEWGYREVAPPQTRDTTGEPRTGPAEPVSTGRAPEQPPPPPAAAAGRCLRKGPRSTGRS